MKVTYKAVEYAPPRTKLAQKTKRMQETPKLKGPLKYEKGKRGTRS